MVAIIRCSGDERQELDWHRMLHGERGEPWVWRPTRRRKNWERSNTPGLTLVLAPSADGDLVQELAWTTRLKRSGDLDQVLEVSRVVQVEPPLSYARVVERLDGRYATHLVDEGDLPDGTGRALVKALTDERRDLEGVISQIGGVADRYPIGDSAAGQIMALQRDASIGAVRMAGMDASDFARWDRPPQPLSDTEIPPAFIGTVPDATTREDRQVDHDARTMLGWVTEQTNHCSWREFRGFGQRLYVANANRDAAEVTLGVDLIYYNVTRSSMILVQYKKLDAKRNGFYYPDSDAQLAKELDRMKSVNSYVAEHRRPDDDFRFGSSPCWIKLCQPEPFIPSTADMVPGMYFSIDHFERLRLDPNLKGPRGGTRFGYANVPSYLDNTMFSRLVETGFIGTSGTSTELIHQQVIKSFEGQKSVVLATLHGEDIPQSKRNTAKRGLARRATTT
jgi:hypothetical protein